MTRIAILCCGNIKNELSCPAIGCLRSFNEKTGTFDRYKDDTEALEEFDSNQAEIDIHRKFGEFYGYMIYILQV